jgi:hypothetical protein
VRAERVRVVQIDPSHTEVKLTERGFTWTFIGRTSGGGRVNVKIDFGAWWITFLARDLWTVIRAKRNLIEQQAEAMNQEPKK